MSNPRILFHPSPLEKRPRSTLGVDYGVEGLILFRNADSTLTYIWEPGHGVWAGRACPQSYHPAGVFRYDGDSIFGTRVTSGRFGRKAKEAVAKDIMEQTGIQIKPLFIVKSGTLVVK